MAGDHDAASTHPYILADSPATGTQARIPNAGLRQQTVTTVWSIARRASLTANLSFYPSLLAYPSREPRTVCWTAVARIGKDASLLAITDAWVRVRVRPRGADGKSLPVAVAAQAVVAVEFYWDAAVPRSDDRSAEIDTHALREHWSHWSSGRTSFQHVLTDAN